MTEKKALPSIELMDSKLNRKVPEHISASQTNLEVALKDAEQKISIPTERLAKSTSTGPLSMCNKSTDTLDLPQIPCQNMAEPTLTQSSPTETEGTSISHNAPLPELKPISKGSESVLQTTQSRSVKVKETYSIPKPYNVNGESPAALQKPVTEPTTTKNEMLGPPPLPQPILDRVGPASLPSALPGMGPPPMQGMGLPSPPPVPGMGQPPPPPMPGMGPPPPPMPGMGPPPPPVPGMGGTPLASAASGTGTPLPFPTPPAGGWMANRASEYNQLALFLFFNSKPHS